MIERQAKHLTRLVDDLLDVSRITRGKLELRKERVELADVVAKAVEIASPLLEQRSHRLTIDVSPNLAVEVDPPRMVQVVANLLTNAASYSDPGGEVLVIGDTVQDMVTLRVIDTGIGISPTRPSSGRAVHTHTRPARHRATRHQWLRACAPATRAAIARRGPAGRNHRLRRGAGGPAVDRCGLRGASRQTGAAGAAGRGDRGSDCGPGARSRCHLSRGYIRSLLP